MVESTFGQYVTELQQYYPQPITFDERENRLGEYCVGGAYLLDNGVSHNAAFPDSVALAVHLREDNPALAYERSQEYAKAIIEANDAGEFELAWSLLDLALHFLNDKTVNIDRVYRG